MGLVQYWIICKIMLLTSTPSDVGYSYIEQYGPIAQAEMHRSGIPASIKLAQGMIESDYGRSDLAQKANNHFGIKCGNTWEGPGYYKEDDDYSSNGQLMKSCFRVFESALQSYASHSDFLRDPKKNYRYGKLFELSSNDYKGWAHGLLASGYATDPRYPEKLISVIEKYNLYLLDNADEVASLENKTTSKDIQYADPTPSKQRIKIDQSEVETSTKAIYSVVKINGQKCHMPKTSTTVEVFAKNIRVSIEELLKHNDHLDFATENVPTDIPIYTSSKLRDYTGKEEYHIVKENETLESISQLYGVRVHTLRSLNRLSANATPLFGEKIALQHKVKSHQRPKYVRKTPKEFIPGL